MTALDRRQALTLLMMALPLAARTPAARAQTRATAKHRVALDAGSRHSTSRSGGWSRTARRMSAAAGSSLCLLVGLGWARTTRPLGAVHHRGLGGAEHDDVQPLVGSRAPGDPGSDACRRDGRPGLVVGGGSIDLPAAALRRSTAGSIEMCATTGSVVRGR